MRIILTICTCFLVSTNGISQPDLMPNFSFEKTVFSPTESINVAINLYEINGVSISAEHEIELFIPKISGIAISLVQDEVTSRRSSDEDAALWIVVERESGLTIKNNVAIEGGSNLVLPLELMAVNPGATGILTINIVPESGGEIFPYNNVATLALSVTAQRSD